MRCRRLLLLFALLSTGAKAQWLHYPSTGIPRTSDGQPNLSAPAPRDSNRKPDLSGLWQVEPTPFAEMVGLFGPGFATLSVPGDDTRTFSKYAINILADFKPQDSPLRTPAAKVKESPTLRCLPASFPFGELLPFPNKIIQTPDVIVILQESDGSVRQIFTDGRKHTTDPQPSWMGYSVGRWENDSLVVDTVGFNDLAWLDAAGHPRSEALRVTERYHRRDFGHLDLEVTLDDPKIFTRVFSVKYTMIFVPDSDVAESVCSENEKDRSHITK